MEKDVSVIVTAPKVMTGSPYTNLELEYSVGDKVTGLCALTAKYKVFPIISKLLLYSVVGVVTEKEVLELTLPS
jgi:hypothetical protein